MLWCSLDLSVPVGETWGSAGQSLRARLTLEFNDSLALGMIEHLLLILQLTMLSPFPVSQQMTEPGF